jgi:Bacterial TniB protein
MNHLNKEIAQIAALDDTERINRILSYKWIGYTRAREIHQTMEYLLIHPKIHRMPNMLLVAATNNGKTILLQRFFDAHKPVITPAIEKISVPVLYVQAPFKPDERMFFINILEALHAPYNVREKALRLYQQVANILKKVETKILIIDEIHHVLAGGHITQRVFLNMIKYLANDLQIVIIASGIRDALSAINTDKQLANRFKPALLPTWKMDEEYLRLLTSFEAILPLRKPSNLTQEDLAMKILSLSGGTIGEISTILKDAAVHAVTSKKECIDLAVLGKIDYVAPAGRQRQYESLLV